jgi:hypothetical protein
MSWTEKDLLFDVPEFKLVSKGWHIVKVTGASIKAVDKAKNPDSKSEKNFVVEMQVHEGSEDDGAQMTKYFADNTQNDFALKQFGALLVCAGVIPAVKITGPEFFNTPAFETNFKMKLPEKLLGVDVDHQVGKVKKDDGTDMLFPQVKRYRTVKDAQALLKKKPQSQTGTAALQETSSSSVTTSDDTAWD